MDASRLEPQAVPALYEMAQWAKRKGQRAKRMSSHTNIDQALWTAKHERRLSAAGLGEREADHLRAEIKELRRALRILKTEMYKTHRTMRLARAYFNATPQGAALLLDELLNRLFRVRT